MSDRSSGDPIEFSFADFVLHYLRDFVFAGVYETDTPLPEVFEPSPYHDLLARAAARRLVEVEAWNEDTADREANATYDGALQARKNRAAAEAARRESVEARLAEVQRWALATPLHPRFKQNLILMLEAQIAASSSYTPPLAPRLTGAEYKAAEIRAAQENLAGHNESHQREIERARQLTELLQAIRENLAQPAAG